MENFKGTPGPWQVVDTYGNYEPYSTETPQIIIWDGDEQAAKSICDMGEMGDFNYAEELANATLIANAPDILECLQKLVTAHENDNTKEYGYWAECGRTAINKALGL